VEILRQQDIALLVANFLNEDIASSRLNGFRDYTHLKFSETTGSISIDRVIVPFSHRSGDWYCSDSAGTYPGRWY
jgi:hypothetical protein